MQVLQLQGVEMIVFENFKNSLTFLTE